MAVVYLSLGSNLGNRKQNIVRAVALLAERVGSISALSSLYETAPWGFESENAFLNAAVCMCAGLLPAELLQVTQQIEREMGRARKTDRYYHDRPIDIDLIFYDELVLDTPDLVLPHPFMQQRGFVLEPLVEIAPDLLHPLLHKSMKTLYRELKNRP